MKYLAEIRKENGLTQFELADLVGVGANSIARYERGEVQPSVDVGMAIAKILHVDLIELFEGPKKDKITIRVSHDWSKFEGGKIDMASNAFDLILDKSGKVGLMGAGNFRNHEGIDKFLADLRLQLESALEAQVHRGAIPQGV